jgi:hypothetical protein
VRAQDVQPLVTRRFLEFICPVDAVTLLRVTGSESP